MSAIPSDIQLETEPVDQTGERRHGLPLSASIYELVIAVAAIAAAVPFLLRLNGHTAGWTTFGILAAGAAASHTYTVRTAKDSSFHTSWVFLIPAAILLPPELVALLGVVMHIPEWLKERFAWYIQTFNICNYTLGNLATWGAAKLLIDANGLIPDEHLRWAAAGLVACVVAVAANHIVLAPMVTLARGHSLREAGVFSFESLSTDFILATLGLAVAAFWDLNPWLIPFAVAPLLLIHRSLAIPQLQAEARVDPKTGLFNARHFAVVMQEELGRAQRFQRPLSLIMADLDLLRDINNTYGHLAGDAVLRGISEVFRQQLRHYDVPARFGGEEFSILLPETPPDQAYEIADRIRRAVAARLFEVETSSEPIRATISMGVAGFPRDGSDMNELVHQADLAVYRAKLQGRNRVLDASDEPLLAQPEKRGPRLVSLPVQQSDPVRPLPAATELIPDVERRQAARPHNVPAPRFFSVPRRLALLVGLVGLLGTAAGLLAAIFGHSQDIVGLVTIIVLVGLGQVLSLEVEETGSISVSAVGALAAAAIIGPRAAIALAITMSAVEWSARRAVFHQLLFNVGALSLASLAAAAIFSVHLFSGALATGVFVASGLLAGLVYMVVNMGLVSIAVGVEGRESPMRVWRERFAWLLPHYAVYGFIAAVIYEAYKPIGAWAIVVFALPLFLMRKTQEAYLKHTQRSAHKLREAAETIQTQNVSLEQANRLLKERSTAAMESLSATVDARDAYTAGHSRRVQQLALAIGRELGLSHAELELLGHAALFHDIGKLGIPDAILLKPSSLTEEEWVVMASHAAEGASIINRLGFLSDAVPAIRHHHERFDGQGYPDGLSGEDIPLGARIIHVADAFDSMLTTRVYRPARPAQDALQELRRMTGSQFCPRCVGALDAIVETEMGDLTVRQPSLVD
ncbi:MAG TPA: diguanylate cyclase [Gaiellaceae bacterium]|jgi:diguanylate cyclase (GGDEF)-like protein/putative nucleotidyltransferase with HDIG domain|nr:diguanylate cyclase [Gaiellaceae bacterium]